MGAGVIIAWLITLQNWKTSREQRAEEFRWKKSELALRTIDAMQSDPLSKRAFSLIDWSNQDFDLPSGEKVRIQWTDVQKALRVETPSALEFPPSECFIRDSFDGFFDHVERIVHLVNIGLIKAEDVRVPLRYWAKRILHAEQTGLSKPCQEYMNHYGYEQGFQLLKTLSEAT